MLARCCVIPEKLTFLVVGQERELSVELVNQLVAARLRPQFRFYGHADTGAN